MSSDSRHLTSALADAFPPWIQERGDKLLASGAVTIVDSAPGEVELSLRDDQPWTVVLRQRRDGGPLYATCDCPAGRRGGGRCRHLWAGLRAAESAGLLAGSAQAVLQQVPPPAPARVAVLDDWRKRLRALSAVDPLGAPAQVGVDAPVYVVDAAQSTPARGLVVHVGLPRPGKSSHKLLPAAFSLADVSRLPDARDREVLAVLFGAASSSSSGPWAGTRGIGPLLVLEGPVALAALPRLCATERCFLVPKGTNERRLLSWDDGPPWVARLGATRIGGSYTLQATLNRGDERRTLDAVVLLFEPGLVFFENQAARLDPGGLFAWLAEAHTRPLPRVPVAEAADLAIELALAVPDAASLELPAELRVELLTPTPRPRLAIRRDPLKPHDRLCCELAFDYDGRLLAPGSTRVRLSNPPRLLARDRQAEQEAEAQLVEAGVRAVRRGRELRREITPRRVPRIVRELLELGWHVEAEGDVYRRSTGLSLSVVSGIDWFDLQGEAEFDGQRVGLASVLQALRRGESMVALGDGALGLLPEEWLRRFGPLARLSEPDESHTRFSLAQAGLLDALLEDEPEVNVDAVFAQARTRLRAFAGVKPCDAPAGFHGELRAYQREGLGFLRFLDEFGFGGCLADDMGLGKTIQVLALLVLRRAEAPRAAPTLVVVPRSLVFNWKSEAARFAPGLRLHDHTGLERARGAAAFDDCDVVLTTYGTLRRDAPLLKEFEFDYVVLDEAQAIKNALSETAKAARLLHGRRRLALSGTPVENHLGEIASLFEFLNPGLLGRLTTLAGRRTLTLEERDVLARCLRPFVLRRTKEQVAPDLPAKTEQTLMCELEGVQRRLYEQVRDEARASLLQHGTRGGMEKSKILVLEALLRLRQAACHPGLIDAAHARAPSAKLEALVPRLGEIVEEGHKALVFSQFTSFLGLLRARLDELGLVYEYLDGRTRDRQARVTRFQNDPDCRIFLVSLKAGGLGLNLTAAEYVFLLDPWWNPAVEAQAIDRSHRIGQQRPVFAYRLIAQDTVEEKVLQLQSAKRELADAILGADASLIRDLKREDLELLLS